MERKNHFPLAASQQIFEQTGRELTSAIRGNLKLKRDTKMQPSPDSPLTLPKQEEGSTGSFEGAGDEGRLVPDFKEDSSERSSFTGKKFKSLLYAPNCIYNGLDLRVIGLS